MNPFQLEKCRDELARSKQWGSLKELYTKAYPTIPNRNKNHLWDKLNYEVHTTLSQKSNPMSYHRLQIVSKNILSGRLLDVGFGSGSLERILKNKDVSVTGIDFSAESVKLASKLFPEWTFQKVNITNDWKLNAKEFDCIICLEVLEHISPEKTFFVLEQIYKYLKHGGKLIVSVPLNEGLEEMIKHGKNPNAHVRIYTPQLLQAELQISGFKPKKLYELYAFGKYYKIKTIITKLFLKNTKLPNTVIVIAEKP